MCDCLYVSAFVCESVYCLCASVCVCVGVSLCVCVCDYMCECICLSESVGPSVCV